MNPNAKRRPVVTPDGASDGRYAKSDPTPHANATVTPRASTRLVLTGSAKEHDSWRPVDLRPVLAGKFSQPVPSLLKRTDGQGLFYLGEVNGIHGASGEGKGWVALVAAAQQLREGHEVVYLDFEDNPASIVGRLQLLGVSRRIIEERFNYVRPTEPTSELALAWLTRLIRRRTVTLVVVDSVGEAFALDGINEDRDVEVAPWFRRICRRFADAGAAVLLVDHSTKATDNALYPSGSKRKRAAVTGASYLVLASTPLVKGKGGVLRLVCAKDRHGTYGRNEAAALVEFDGTADRALKASVRVPGKGLGASDDRARLVAMAAVEAAKVAGEPLSQTQLISRMAIRAGSDAKRAALDYAAEQGALSVTPGLRSAHMYSFEHDLPGDKRTKLKLRLHGGSNRT